MRCSEFAPLRDLAAIGDGHSVALVARDGAIDWLCLPHLDSPSVFGALLDPDRGGRFVVQPEEPARAERRYLPDTNVLETTFETPSGRVRLTDALTLGIGRPLPWREIARRVEGLAGRVPLRWRFEPRFGFGQDDIDLVDHEGMAVARRGLEAMGLLAWDAGKPTVSAGAVEGRFETAPGMQALLGAVAVHDAPIPRPARSEVERRLEGTAETWRRVLGAHTYEGDWAGAVRRSILALGLLVDTRSGAMAAAPTTSLPERIGGSRNYDYRFCWIRDSTLVIDAFLRLGHGEEAHRSLTWLLRAVSHTAPRLEPMYRLDAHVPAGERTVDMAGYRHSRPVRDGNAAAGQLQLDAYGNLLQAVWLFTGRGNVLDDPSRWRITDIVEGLAETWTEPDSGIWELPDRHRYTQSAMAVWVAFDRAVRLAERGDLPEGRHVDRWRRERDAVRRFVEERCWSEERRSYGRAAGSDELDAACLRMPRMGYDTGSPRHAATIAAVRRELGRGPFLYRFTGAPDQEGAFVACSFWLVEALALTGSLDEATELMDELVGLANDVGLYSEEMDPDTGDFLGNFPQGLSHMALLNAAATIEGVRNAPSAQAAPR